MGGGERRDQEEEKEKARGHDVEGGVCRQQCREGKRKKKSREGTVRDGQKNGLHKYAKWRK
jgi:hypothetical protein